MHPLLQKIKDLQAKAEMLARRDLRLRCAKASHIQECYEVDAQIEKDFLEYNYPITVSVDTYSGWQSRARQVNSGEKGRHINGATVFHITQTRAR